MPARVRIQALSDGKDTFSSDTDVELPAAPKPSRRTGHRKSLGTEASFSDSVPQNINDDEAEKRRRRKSTKPPPEPQQQEDPEPSAAAARRRRVTAVELPKIDVSKDVMNSNFDQWMKMHTDGKINANNSWNVFLIDYFQEGSLLRNANDNSINFQRASYTLDGCVKIWTSRIDSVGTDTAKLASNLASGRNDAGLDSEDETAEAEGDGAAAPKRKRVHRHTSTLKEAAQLRSKKIETEFMVDPLFKKTCADFDEGGAGGLLMNHLSMGIGEDGCLRVSFDAGDSIVQDVEDEEEEDLIDLTHLRDTYLPDIRIVDNLEICEELAGFSFSQDQVQSAALTQDLYNEDDSHSNNFDSDPNKLQDDMDGDLGPSVSDAGPVDFFQTNEADDFDDLSADFGGGDEAFGGFGEDDVGDADGQVGRATSGDPTPSGSSKPFHPSNLDGRVQIIQDGENALASFDLESKNWAGPEFFRRSNPRAARRDAQKTTIKHKQPRQKKEPVKIDFTIPNEDEEKSLDTLIKEMFARGAKGKGKASNMLSSKKTSSNRRANMLPDDMHFTSQQLVSLFLKPKFSLTGTTQAKPNDSGEYDAESFAHLHDDNGMEDDDDHATPTQGFDDQAFDDQDDPNHNFEDGWEATVNDEMTRQENDLLASTQNHIPRVRPPTVAYAKRAKRVDVKRLKDNIWRGLDIVTPHNKAEDGMDVDEDTCTDPSQAREFKDVITNLQGSYTPDRMEEISTSYCFICLLHLANEKGLRLDKDSSHDESNISNLWDVKVFRDPDAKPAA